MKKIEVAFIDKNLEKAFNNLKERKYEDEKLRKFILRAVEDLKQNPECGIRIPKKLIPKEYLKKYKITNIWKYNLPDAWRLIYTITEDEISIVSILIEWFKHKNYERRFSY
ncbi:MAG: type II toxin-antitoxin system RelE/ParE family toxin [Nanoarchaeota archaeon]|nr:type II toxin-antitoxin system RelE/ParE family toxin [Nanoarchaeota archaeon]